MKHHKSLALLVSGAGALVIAIALVTVLKNDFALGVSFGSAIGLLILGVYSLSKPNGALKPALKPKR